MTGSEVVQVTADRFSSRAPMRTPRAAFQFVRWRWAALQPNAMAITRNGATRYVAALGSSKIGIYNTHRLEQNTFVSDQANQIPTRSDNPLTAIDTTSRREVSKFSLYNPDPVRAKMVVAFSTMRAIVQLTRGSRCLQNFTR